MRSRLRHHGVVSAILHKTACLLSLAIAVRAPAAKAALTTQCWRVVNSQLTKYDGVPCGVVTADSPIVACCNANSLCLQDSICQAPGTPSDGFTGYYIAGCLDSNYLDSTCSPYCKDLYRADIVYNNASRTWSCCGTESDNNTVNCLEPTNEEFDDPAPVNLSATFSAGTTASTSAATSSSSSSTNTRTTSSSSSSSISPTTSLTLPLQTGPSQPSSRGGLSTGAKAGIGVGVAFGAIVVLVGGVLFIRRRQKNEMKPKAKELPTENGREAKVVMQELGGRSKPAELASEPAEVIHEMYVGRR